MHRCATPLSLGIGHAATEQPPMPSAHWGDRQIWGTRVDNHNMMIDLKGVADRCGARRDNPAFCKVTSTLEEAPSLVTASSRA